MKTVEMPPLEQITVHWSAERPMLRFHIEGASAGDVVFRAESPEKLLAAVTQGYGNALLKIRQQQRLIRLLTTAAR